MIPTTTPTTCASHKCNKPDTLRIQPGRLMCPPGGCSQEICCLKPTTTLDTCATFNCPAPTTIRFAPASLVCGASGCTKDLCCLEPTTTPAPLTCASFSCPAPKALRFQPDSLSCVGACTEDLCCLTGTTTPGSPCTTQPPVAKLYSAKEAEQQQRAVTEQKDAQSASWALPTMGVFAMLSFVVAARVYGRRAVRRTSTREVNFDSSVEDGALMENEGPVE